MHLASESQYLNLVHFSARLTTEPEYEDLLANLLIEYEKRWPSRPIDLMGAQDVGDKTELHHFRMDLEEERNEKHIDVQMDYFLVEKSNIRAKGKAQRGRDMRAVQRILEFLESSKTESHFHCNVDWEFPRSLYSTLISLPLMRLNMSGVHFDKISGVRLSGVGPNRNVILDQTLDESATTVNAFFNFYNLWGPQIIQRVFQEGESLIEPLIFENPQESTDAPQN